MPYINVTLTSGRTPEAKQSLMSAITQAVHDSIGADPDAVRIWITEVAPEDMAIGGVGLDKIRAQRAAATAGAGDATGTEAAAS